MGWLHFRKSGMYWSIDEVTLVVFKPSSSVERARFVPLSIVVALSLAIFGQNARVYFHSYWPSGCADRKFL